MMIYIYKDEVCLRRNDSSVSISKNNCILQQIPIKLIEAVIIFGRTSISTELIKTLTQNGINIFYCSKSGRLNAITNSFSLSNTNTRLSQYNIYINYDKRLSMAKQICRDKINLQIALLSKKRSIDKQHIRTIKKYLSRLSLYNDINSIMGIEGCCAREYFNAISEITEFSKRIRHPARDPLNSILDLSYSLILGEITSVLSSMGFDVSIGFLHEIKNGRPSLALDVLEYFRVYADGFAINAFNRREFNSKDFNITEKTCRLTDAGFKKYIKKFSHAVQISDKIFSVCNKLKKDVLERGCQNGQKPEPKPLYNCV